MSKSLFLLVYYQSNEWAGLHGLREKDRDAWALKQEWGRRWRRYFLLLLPPDALPPPLAREKLLFMPNALFFLRMVLASRPCIQSSRLASHFSCFRAAEHKEHNQRLIDFYGSTGRQRQEVGLFQMSGRMRFSQSPLKKNWIKPRMSFPLVQPTCFVLVRHGVQSDAVELGPCVLIQQGAELRYT